MREVVYDIDLNLQEYDIKACMQNDDIKLIVNILKKEKLYDLTGAKATLNWSKPDGTPLRENMNIDKNMISVTLNKDYTDIKGKARLDIEITKEGTISTFPLVLVIVEKVFQSNKVNNKIVELLDIIKMDEYVDEFLDGIKKKQAELSSQIDEIEKNTIKVNLVDGSNDSEKIKNAILKAKERNIKVIEFSDRDYVITETILLPSDFTMIIDNCTIKLSEGIQDNIITNEGTRTIPLSSNKNINIIGKGNAIIDGQADLYKNFGTGNLVGTKYYNDYHRVGLLLFNTQNFSIKNIKVREPQGWGISIENGCCYGEISNIIFEANNSINNQDGINIRKGCHDINIENIYGKTGDDVIAITALYYIDDYSNCFQVGGNEKYGEVDDIYNISIRNVVASCSGGHHTIRLLNHNTLKIHDINIDNVIDITEDIINKACIKIGDVGYYQYAPDNAYKIKATEKDTYNIRINNIESKSEKAIYLANSCSNIIISNITAKDVDNIIYVGAGTFINLDCKGVNIINTSVTTKNVITFKDTVSVLANFSNINTVNVYDVFLCDNLLKYNIICNNINMKNSNYLLKSINCNNDSESKFVLGNYLADKNDIFDNTNINIVSNSSSSNNKTLYTQNNFDVSSIYSTSFSGITSIDCFSMKQDSSNNIRIIAQLIGNFTLVRSGNSNLYRVVVFDLSKLPYSEKLKKSFGMAVVQDSSTLKYYRGYCSFDELDPHLSVIVQDESFTKAKLIALDILILVE